MKQILFSLTLLAAGVGGLCAQTGTTQADSTNGAARKRYEALVRQYETAQSDFNKAYSKANTDAEREKLHYPSADNYAGLFLALAQEQPADPVALDALVWVATNCRDSKEQKTSLDLLLKDHWQSRQLGRVADSIIYARPGLAEPWLRAVLKNSPHHEVKGHAAYSLGRCLDGQADYAASLQKDPSNRAGLDQWLGKATVDRLLELSPDSPRLEAEKLFEDVAANYSDVKDGDRNLADSARSELFEIRNLALGQVAPEIKGEDVDGKEFKLSDYRGKVVVIDFWGDW
jgi:hypothetical protein